MNSSRFFALVALGAALAGSPGFVALAEDPPRQVERVEYGVVEHIDLYREGRDSTTGAGAVIGGLAGGVIGHQIGNGRGNTAATIAGTLGGAAVGNSIEKSRARDRYRIGVRLDSGARLEFDEDGESSLRVGDRVRVVNGRVHRE